MDSVRSFKEIIESLSVIRERTRWQKLRKSYIIYAVFQICPTLE